MNDEQFFDQLKKRGIPLNEQQRAAVTAVNGPTLLLAVPGSGKTTTLIARIGYMVYCRGIDPRQILILTYTRAATRDMERRFGEIFGTAGRTPVKFRTINGLCYGILNENARRFNLLGWRLETDTTDIIISLYRKCYRSYPSEGDISEAKRVIAYIKNMGSSPEERRALKIGEYDAESLYRAYVDYMKRNHRIDFDDQLIISQRILTGNPDIRQNLRERYPFIMVDEAQDTSRIQHEIISLLAGDNPNLFMVGDEDQSIYGFRAAYPQALLDFEGKYPGAKVLLLEENFRSTPQIVTAAGRLIDLNKNRKQKHMVTHRPAGMEINIIGLDSRYNQYAYLLKCLENAKATTAVLMRNNESAIPLIHLLRRAGIPYRCRGLETTFFSHKVVQDVRDFVMFARDQADAEIFMRIYYKTGLWIKKEHAVATVRQYDPDCDEGLFHTYRRIFGTKRNAGKLLQVINGLAELKNDYAWEAIGRIEYSLRETKESEREKFFILRVLADRREKIEDYFRKLEALREVIRRGDEDPDERVFISTIHSSKGLEYDEVFIIDALDGILPAADADDPEEERRLFYVAMTRAKNRLHLMRYKNEKMPFVDAVEKGLRNRGRGQVKPPAWKPGTQKNRGAKPAADYFQLGDRVTHISCGPGKIVGLQDDKIIVEFGGSERVKLQAGYCVTNGLIKKV